MKMIETANVQNEEVLKFFQSEHITICKSKVASGEWVLLPRLSEEEKSAVDEFSSNCIPVKMAETGHQKDPKREYIRIYNGKCAEWALMKHLGLEPPDMTIGESRLHMGKDIELFGEKFGIKCSVVGQAALVFKKPVMPEIILVQRNDDYYLCGIASMKVMRENNDIKLMKSALNSQKAGLTIEGYRNLQQLEGTLKYLKLRNATSKTTGLTVQKTCEQFVELYENKEFKAILDGHAATQKAFEK